MNLRMNHYNLLPNGRWTQVMATTFKKKMAKRRAKKKIEKIFIDLNIINNY